MRIDDAAKAAGKDPYDFVFEILIANRGSVSCVWFIIDENDLKLAMKQPWVSIGSDGSALATSGPLRNGVPHPRNFGTFPRVLGKYVREEKVIPLEQAVHKMSGLTARQLHITDRGLIKDGLAADLVIFDPATVIDRADLYRSVSVSARHPHRHRQRPRRPRQRQAYWRTARRCHTRSRNGSIALSAPRMTAKDADDRRGTSMKDRALCGSSRVFPRSCPPASCTRLRRPAARSSLRQGRQRSRRSHQRRRRARRSVVRLRRQRLSGPTHLRGEERRERQLGAPGVQVGHLGLRCISPWTDSGRGRPAIQSRHTGGNRAERHGTRVAPGAETDGGARRRHRTDAHRGGRRRTRRPSRACGADPLAPVGQQ